MSHPLIIIPVKIATVVLTLCGLYFLLLACYLLLSPFLPIAFGTALGVTPDFFPIATNLGFGLIVLALPFFLISVVFLGDAYFLHRGSLIAKIIAIVFLLLPMTGLLLKPDTFFLVRNIWEILELIMRVLFLALGVSLLVVLIHEKRHGQ